MIPPPDEHPLSRHDETSTLPSWAPHEALNFGVDLDADPAIAEFASMTASAVALSAVTRSRMLSPLPGGTSASLLPLGRAISPTHPTWFARSNGSVVGDGDQHG